MDEHARWASRQRLEAAAKALGKHGFRAVVVETREEAAEAVLAEVPAGASVGVGGSVTIRQLGVMERLEARGNAVTHHWRPGVGHEDDQAWRRAEVAAEVFLCSSNAVTLSGELVNVDGIGNRVAAQIFGPGKVVFVAGVNKLCRDVADGTWRTRNVASPANAHRLGLKLPCGLTGLCTDCDAPDRVCRALVVLERAPSRTPTTVILVNQDLGY
jgi:hypothetical protein